MNNNLTSSLLVGLSITLAIALLVVINAFTKVNTRLDKLRQSKNKSMKSRRESTDYKTIAISGGMLVGLLVSVFALIGILVNLYKNLQSPSIQAGTSLGTWVTVLLAGIVTILVMFNLNRIQILQYKPPVIERRISNSDEPQTDISPFATRSNAESWVNLSIDSLHYVKSEQIQSFYTNVFREPTIENMVSEVIGEVKGVAKANVPTMLEAQLGTKDVSKWVSTIKLPDMPLEGMVQRLQREVIRRGTVTLGIEEVNIELTELQFFNEIIQNLERRFEFKIEAGILTNQRNRIKEKAAEKTLIKLEQAKDLVLLDGQFQIQKAHDGFYKLAYTHPVNEYLPSGTIPVTISVLIEISDLQTHVAPNYAQSIGKFIPLKIFGKVWSPVNRKNGEWDLQVVPLAIY